MILLIIVIASVVAVVYFFNKNRGQAQTSPQDRQSKNAIIFPLFGMLSVIIGFLILEISGFNVHTGEAFMLILIPLITFIVIPTLSFVKSLDTIKNKLGQEKSRIRTYSIILTTTLGGVLTCLLLGLLWIIVR